MITNEIKNLFSNHVAKKKLSKDTYRPQFCLSEFYIQNQNEFKHMSELCRDKQLNLQERLQCWTIFLLLLRRPNDWFSGYRKTSLIVDLTETKPHLISLNDISQISSISIHPKVSKEMNLINLANQVLIKPVPDSVMRSLILINKTYPIRIIDYIPSAYELLQIQISGSRVITFNEDFKEWAEFKVNDRDFLSFVLHDLIHADHFFRHNDYRRGQVGFYKCVDKIIHTKELQLLLLNSEFSLGFEYIISDMNSHPVHLFKTLHAHLSKALKSLEAINEVWVSWALIWSEDNAALLEALRNINTQLFCDKNALTITETTIALSHN